MNLTFWSNFTYIVFIVFFAYFILLVFYYVFLAIAGAVEGMHWARRKEEEDHPLYYFTNFNFPVSIIIPASNEEIWINDSVKSVLNLNYPKFELIIVDDGSTDGTYRILNDMLELYSTEMVYIKHYKDGKTNDILRSRKYPNVTVIRKDKGQKKAGAANAGLNIAKYDYVCVMDADTVLEQDSLLNVMTEVQNDPERIVGAGSYFGLSNGLKIKDGVIAQRSFSYNPLIAYQNLEYIRSFFGNRVGLSRFNAMPNVAGGFGIWRRDIIYALGGYSSEYSSEDLELTFRVHKYIADEKLHYNIVMLPYYAAWTEGPSNIRSLIAQRDRWQRVVIETTWNYKGMFLNPKYGNFAFLVFPYYVLYEVMGVFFEIISVIFVALGWAFGVLDFKVFLAFIILMLVSQAIFSLSALFSFVRSQKLFSKSYMAYLIFLSLAEFLFYRWIISIAKLSGTINYLRGKRIFDQYTRAKRGS